MLRLPASRIFRCKPLSEGRYASISDTAAGEKIERGYLGTLLRLTRLAPETILDGRAASAMALEALLRPLPEEWAYQRKCLTLE